MRTFTTSKGHVFTFTHTGPYIRKDGTATPLEYWRSPCRHPGCDGFVETGTPVGADLARYKTFGLAHCPEHRMTKQEATAAWASACRKANTRATPEAIKQIYRLRDAGFSIADIALVAPVGAPQIYHLLSKRAKNNK